ncbi:MAG: DUF2141 domain-containing protein [Crocinitomicaceae bacterium]
MKTLIITITLLLTLQLSAQSEMFQQKMGEALAQYGQCRTAEDFINTSFKFEQIANVEKQNWLPEYYFVMCYTMASYNVKADNPAQKDKYLDMAETHIATLKTIAPEEAEVFALEALFYTARLSVNPMDRGQKYSMLSQKSVGTALAMDPNNLRAKQMKIANDFGTAQFFGSDTAPLCEKAQVLLADWDNYPSKSPFHPNWGKRHLTSIAKSCEPKTEVSEIKQENSAVTSPKLTLEITNLTSNEGIILIQIKDASEKVVMSTKGNIKDNKSTIVFNDLPAGEYGISYFHDANTNMKMDSDKYGRPLEGYGYSNNAKAMMKAPDFKDTIFTLDKDLTLSLKTRN